MKYYLHILIVAAALMTSAVGNAQQQSSTSSEVKRRSATDLNKAATSTQPGVTDRMLYQLEENPSDDADAQWLKIVYRQLDLNDVKNATLYYPEDVIDGQESLIRIIMRLLAAGEIPAYEYLDGREIFSDTYKVNVRDLLDRFHVMYTENKGSLTIDESDVPATEVLSYYILERWELDKKTTRMKTTVEALCPVLHRDEAFNGDVVRYPMFWVKMSDLRPYLMQHSVFVDDDNNLPQYTYDDFFRLGMYSGEIYKTRNLRNKSMAQLYPDPDERKQAADSIQERLVNFEKKMWVPTREEVLAQKEGTKETIATRDTTKKSTSAARAKRASRPKTVKQKSSSSQSTVTRSVRQRK
jgi:gliding motility associated protien GldN